MSDTEYQNAVTAAIRHIGISTYSSGKIYSYLIDKGYPEGISSRAVSELIERGYINDTKASRKVIIARTGKKQESRDYILKRLIAAGIDRDVAEIVVSGLDDDKVSCVRLFESLGFDSDSEENRNEMIAIASRRGYTYETASAAYQVWSENI